MTVPTPLQVGTLLAAADDRFTAFIPVSTFGGLRLGEAAALQGGDMDFLRRRLLVSRQVQRGPGGSVELRAPKHGSERTIVVPDRLLNLLAAHIEQHVAAGGPERWLFPPPQPLRRTRTPSATSGARRPPGPASAAFGCTTSGTSSRRVLSRPGATSSPWSGPSSTPRRPRP